MIEVISAGIYSSIQDQGRFGFRNIGVPLAGVMDQYLSLVANQLVANPKEASVLEMTFAGPTLKFHQDTFIAICAGDQIVLLNDQNITINSVLEIKSGDVLKLASIARGARSYLAVAGGFQSEITLKSQSQYQGITTKGQIQKGEILKINKSQNKIQNRSSIKLDSQHFENTVLEIYAGPEFNLLSKEAKAKIFRKKYKISAQSNRMAYKLEASVNLSADEIITSSVQPGTVQLTPSGELMILMRDCQTTGGYARILQLTEKSINQLAQKQAGSKLSFSLLGIDYTA